MFSGCNVGTCIQFAYVQRSTGQPCINTTLPICNAHTNCVTVRVPYTQSLLGLYHSARDVYWVVLKLHTTLDDVQRFWNYFHRLLGLVLPKPCDIAATTKLTNLKPKYIGNFVNSDMYDSDTKEDTTAD